MIEILTRLPPKSLVRFRSVSKSLRSCIDSPDFIRMHTCRSPQRLLMTHLALCNYVKKYGDAAFYTLHTEDQLPLCPISGYTCITGAKFPSKDVNIVGSCNGIICLYDFEKGIISLWNPTIMRQLIVPKCPQRCAYGMGIGLGFDPITEDNKIVSIPIDGNVIEGIVGRSFVYAMKTGDWRPIASPMPMYSIVLSRACYLNGVLHWVVVRHFTNSKEIARGYIMTLDLSTHVFGTIDLPKPNWVTQDLTTIQGSLGVISSVYDDSWIWVKKDASWSVVFKSKINQVQAGVRRVVELTNNGDLLLDTFREGLQVHNLKTGAQSTLVDFNDTSSLFEMDSYVETLELLHMGTACKPNHILLQDKKATSSK